MSGRAGRFSKYGVDVSPSGKVARTVGGVTFASKRESERYITLHFLEQAGYIRDLELQPTFRIEVNGKLIARYLADFRYFDRRTDRTVVEDVKSAATRTPLYRLKKKLVEALHGVTIEEV